jgi:hypothetical protein
MPSAFKNPCHSTDPYPDLWKRARKFMDEKYPDLHGIPSKEMLIDFDDAIDDLLKEAGF